MPSQDMNVDPPLTDLIAAAVAGDDAACAMLYQRHVQQTYRLAYGVLLNEQDAEEVVQDSFAYAFQTLKHYDPARSAFRTWLYTITMSRCRNKRRRKWLPTVNLAEISEWATGSETPPERAADQRHTRHIVLTALGKLSPKLREAVVLRYFDGLSYREMAEVMGCPQKTAQSRVRLAHEALFDLLAGQSESLFEGMWGHDRSR